MFQSHGNSVQDEQKDDMNLVQHLTDVLLYVFVSSQFLKVGNMGEPRSLLSLLHLHNYKFVPLLFIVVFMFLFLKQMSHIIALASCFRRKLRCFRKNSRKHSSRPCLLSCFAQPVTLQPVCSPTTHSFSQVSQRLSLFGESLGCLACAACRG